MNQISENIIIKCSKHSNKEALYIKIDDIKDNNYVFYCELCNVYDNNDQPSNFILKEHVINAHSNSITDVWPPLQDNKINKEISKLIRSEDNISEQVKDFFDDFKKQVNHKIDLTLQRILEDKNILKMKQKKQNLLEGVNEISKIQQLQNLLTDKTTNPYQKEQQYKDFISEFSNKKEQNSKILSHLLDQYQVSQIKINLDLFNQIRESTISGIEELYQDISNQKQDRLNYDQYLQQPQINGQQQQEGHLLLSEQQLGIIEQQIQLKNLLDGFQFNKSSQKDIYSQDHQLLRLQNNSLQIKSKENTCGTYYSNLILDKSKKYVFRFSFERDPKEHQLFILGLGKEFKINRADFYKENLSCGFIYNKNYNGHVPQFGINTEVRGSLQKTGDVNCIELRVWIDQQQLEVLDYPNYSNKISLESQYQENLITNDNYRLFMYLQDSISVTLTHAAEVLSFNY